MKEGQLVHSLVPGLGLMHEKSVSAAVHSVDPTVPLSEVAMLDQIRDRQLVDQSLNLFCTSASRCWPWR